MNTVAQMAAIVRKKLQKLNLHTVTGSNEYGWRQTGQRVL